MNRYLQVVLRGATLWIALHSGLAHSQVHMCKGADGRKTFSDVPCGPKSELLEVRPPGGPSVNPSTSMQIEYYDIRGTTFAELRREIDAKGPEGFWGNADSRVSYRFVTRAVPDGCGIESVRAMADSKVRLPRWANRHAAPPALQDYWDGAARTLELHERGHVQINLDAAKDVERTLLEMPPQSTCAIATEVAKGRAAAVLLRLRERQVSYDRETDHGRKQWSPYRDNLP